MILPEISSLSIDQKIGQMVLFGIPGESFDEKTAGHLTKLHVGNIILFSRNYIDTEQLSALTGEIKSVLPIYPLIAIDQEGGVVTRLTSGASLLPGNRAIAETDDPELAKLYGKIIGSELRALGINLNLAPVLDLFEPGNPGIGVRSFGSTAEKVAKYGLPLIKGLLNEGVGATAKHFPGLGSARFDTHFKLPLITKLEEELIEDIAPFILAIEAGIPAVMTSHASYKAYNNTEERTPGTFNPAIMTGLLREKLGFEGVLITDDLEMGAAVEETEFRDCVVKSVIAGADLLSICKSPERQIAAVESLKHAVEERIISEERIDVSVKRIFRMKADLHVKTKKLPANNFIETYNKNKTGCETIIDRVIKISGNKNTLPLDSEKSALLVVPELREFTPVEELKNFMLEAENAMIDGFKNHLEHCSVSRYTLPPTNKQFSEILRSAGKVKIIIFCSYNAHIEPKQRRLIEELDRISPNLILLMLRDPEDAELSGKALKIAAYAPVHTVIKHVIPNLF